MLNRHTGKPPASLPEGTRQLNSLKMNPCVSEDAEEWKSLNRLKQKTTSGTGLESLSAYWVFLSGERANWLLIVNEAGSRRSPVQKCKLNSLASMYTVCGCVWMIIY